MNKEIRLTTPLSKDDVKQLNIGDCVYISGKVYCGRDAVLPRIVAEHLADNTNEEIIRPEGSIVFHTAVSPAGVGPTSSNKEEIEASIEPLSRAGVRMHLGKGKLSKETIQALDKYDSVYAVIPPVTALLSNNMTSVECVAYPELGMEALYEITVKDYPAIIAAANGESIYDNR